MKSTDLRIGNLIDLNGEICVVGVGILEMMYRQEKGNPIAETPIFNPLPIELNHLFKSNFKPVRENIYEYSWNKIKFRIERLAGCYWLKSSAGTTESKPLKYVHELQNLFFSLHGEELTLKQ